MGEKNVKVTGFTATKKELKIIDQFMRKNYRMNKSEVIRMLINAGAESLSREREPETKTGGQITE